ncbi:MAG: ABC transporter substrate-binding protein [Chloroflexi bacterium]|nr:ABC transporter substrate-binding protein [Chloroflexota bacterium]
MRWWSAAGGLVLAGVLVLLLVGASLHLPSPPPNPRAVPARLQGILRIGIDPSYPPIAALDGRGNLVGLDVDVAVELARRLGVRPEFVGMDLGGIFDALLQRRFDIIISGIPPLPEYAREVIYSQPYLNAGLVLLVPAGSATLRTPPELRGVVAVEVGGQAEAEVRQLARRQPIELLLVDSPAGVVAAVRSGRAVAGIVERLAAAEHASPESGVVVAGPPFTLDPYVIAARREDEALLAAIDAALAAMRADGTLARIESRWLDPARLHAVDRPTPAARP